MSLHRLSYFDVSGKNQHVIVFLPANLHCQVSHLFLPCSAHSQIHLQRLLDGNKCAFIEPAIKYWYTEAADKEAQEKEEVEREEEEEMGDLTM